MRVTKRIEAYINDEVCRRKTFFEKLVDKVGNKWYNKTKGD